jgi:RNA polymerase sigma-70 factor (ECF subfamily)
VSEHESNRKPDDAVWLQRIRAGDASAMDELFASYFEPLVGFGTALVKQQDAAEDLVQDVLFAIWARRGTLAIHTSLRTYLFTAVRNAALNHLRAERVRSARIDIMQLDDDTAGSDRAVKPGSSSHAMVENEERRRLVQTAIDALPDPYRSALALRANGLDYDEAAAVLGVPVKTVRTQVARGIQRLRKALLKKF